MEIGQSTYNLKSVISVLSARISRPKTVVLICDGPEEEQALKELGDFLEGPIQ
jgi:phosphotransferase system HPr-like phosphotransfer protein